MRIIGLITLIVSVECYGNYGDFNAFQMLQDPIEKISSSYVTFNWKEWMKPIEMSTRQPLSETYDFIIVGSGSAGSVIANRLSEVSKWNILLLEVGTGENLFSRIPLAAPVMSLTPYSWKYFMERQENISQGMVNERMYWPRGRALGGTSVINYMIYTRGNRNDYDRWAASGNPGWSYDDVLPYFIKSERANLGQYADLRFHGTEGPLSVEHIYQSQLLTSFMEGARDLGEEVIDYNANLQGLGVAPMQANVLRGQRHTTARAFLKPISNVRANLKIVTSAFVTQLLIDRTNSEAYGVEYERYGKTYRVGARREVILSAGTFNSPQLLMLAGIGPRDHLEEMHIPVLKDLPVGHNLQDHLTFPGLGFTLDEDVALSVGKLATKEAVLGFLLNGTGPFVTLGGVEGIGYIKTPLAEYPEEIPDVELMFVWGTLATEFGLFTRRWMNIKDEVYDGLFRSLHNIPTWTIFPMVLHPKSVGYMKLKSRDPHDHPIFYGNYFTDPQNKDIDTFVAAIRWAQALSATDAFQRFGSRLNRNRHPGCESFTFDSDDYWRCALRSIAVTLHHQIGTCKMGPRNDPNAVVNHELKVYGVGRLRVADCSIIPFAIGAHTNAPAVMVGEKASDLIKQTWGEL